MPDYRNPNSDYRSARSPVRREIPADPDKRAANTAWGWLVAAVLMVAVLAVAFGFEHRSGQTDINTASNEAPPPVTIPASPATPPANTMTPPPANPAAPLAVAPNTPAQRGTAHP
jgi:hypothetical protein